MEWVYYKYKRTIAAKIFDVFYYLHISKLVIWIYKAINPVCVLCNGKPYIRFNEALHRLK